VGLIQAQRREAAANARRLQQAKALELAAGILEHRQEEWYQAVDFVRRYEAAERLRLENKHENAENRFQQQGERIQEKKRKADEVSQVRYDRAQRQRTLAAPSIRV
jgi:hypothetical protein